MDQVFFFFLNSLKKIYVYIYFLGKNTKVMVWTLERIKVYFDNFLWTS